MIGLDALQRQWRDVGSQMADAFARVGASGWYILGNEVSAFERELAAFAGVSNAVGTANGMDALEIALRACGLRPGDLVATTPLSAFATTLAIVRAGGIPVFIDVDDAGLLDLDALERALVKHSIRAVVPVHLYGHPLDLESLARIKHRHSLIVVEDACQAIGASFGDIRVGQVGDASALSFYPTKNLGAMGDGGAVLTLDAEIAARAACLRDYGQQGRYEHEVLGLNSRLDEVHAALLRVALTKLPEWAQRRRQIAMRYIDGIAHEALRIACPGSVRAASVWHLMPVIVRDISQRASFAEHMKSRGVHTARHYPRLIPEQVALRDHPFHVFETLANAQRIAASEVSIPVQPQLTDAEIGAVIDACNSWIAR